MVTKEEAKSFLKISEERIKYSGKELSEQNINFVFEDYYSSLVEILHAIILLDCYKVLNHICLGNYIKDVLKREDLFNIFDSLRYKRNSLTYYGKKMDFEVGKDAIKKSKKLISELKKYLGKLK
jgi:uncharacterized protein (UPF0332 family)